MTSYITLCSFYSYIWCYLYRASPCFSAGGLLLQWTRFPLEGLSSVSSLVFCKQCHREHSYTSSYSNILPLTSLWDTAEMLAWKGFVQLTKWYISKLFFQRLHAFSFPQQRGSELLTWTGCQGLGSTEPQSATPRLLLSRAPACLRGSKIGYGCESVWTPVVISAFFCLFTLHL